MTDMVPIAAYLRKAPDLAAIQTAIAETVATGDSLASITPKARQVIRTEPVQMSDGRVHGVHVWTGPVGAEPERPTPGPLRADLTAGVATDTVESLTNAGLDPAEESMSGRAFAEAHAQSRPRHRTGQGAGVDHRRRARPNLLHHRGLSPTSRDARGIRIRRTDGVGNRQTAPSISSRGR